ncbi:MAG: hypothetical protein WC393_02710 [Candidatus Nanoarchaeia archaeon]
MATLLIILFLNFLISLVVSACIIYFVTKMFGEKESLETAVKVAVIGAVIYTLSYYFLGTGSLAAIIGGIAWLVALESLYSISWIKALLISLFIWIIVSILSFLPTVAGPL